VSSSVNDVDRDGHHYKVTRFYFEHISLIHTLVGNPIILTQEYYILASYWAREAYFFYSVTTIGSMDTTYDRRLLHKTCFDS
jgi:hypothetical protein